MQKQTRVDRLPFPVLLPLVLILLIPIVELSVMVSVAGRIGVLTTVALVVLMSLVGAAVARRAGLGSLRRLQQALDAKRPPVAEVFDGFCVLLAGGLLVLPGFVTDIVGVILLLPPVRALLYKAVARRMERQAARRPTPGPRGVPVIEGEYEEIEPPAEPRAPRGGWGPR